VVVEGAVVGVRAQREGADVWLGARRGVVLACGGFEWNAEMIRGFIGYDIGALSPPNNVGDGLAMAMEAGARLANMNSYWGTPVMFDPGIVRDGKPVPQFEGGRNSPGNIVVNRHGVRFANEGLPYNDFPKAFGIFDPTAIEFPNEAPAWMIFDHGLKESTQILSIVPGRPAPDWVPQAPTIRQLAQRIGVDPDTLEATVDRFNKFAAAGEDPDFGRHRVALMGVPPLRPVDQAPFYALQMYPGALGTNGGPKLNGSGQVISQRGGPIPGLYAAGNTAANVFGWAYPSGGGTIANGAVFGYLAGRHAAAQPPRAVEA
jgi:succinate dehydrogenase/fumarate reductase flavoprotein subunit